MTLKDRQVYDKLYRATRRKRIKSPDAHRAMAEAGFVHSTPADRKAAALKRIGTERQSKT